MEVKQGTLEHNKGEEVGHRPGTTQKQLDQNKLRSEAEHEEIRRFISELKLKVTYSMFPVMLPQVQYLWWLNTYKWLTTYKFIGLFRNTAYHKITKNTHTQTEREK